MTGTRPTVSEHLLTVLVALLLGLAGWVAIATGWVQTYDAPGNAGVLIAHSVGVEVRGTPGVFTCDGQC